MSLVLSIEEVRATVSDRDIRNSRLVDSYFFQLCFMNQDYNIRLLGLKADYNNMQDSGERRS